MTQLIDCGEFETLSNTSSSSATPTDVIPSEGQDDVDYTDYRIEKARLDSFANWTSIINPERLAAAGFYYIGKSDSVRCFECRLELCKWTKDDDPMVDHQRWSGSCRFIRKIPCGNVPIGTNPDTIPPMNDLCRSYGIQYKPNSFPDTKPDEDNGMDKITIELEKLRTGELENPKYPEYATYTSRLLTYEKWPATKTQKKETMALAGFYYLGSGDYTLCHYCGGGLKDWKPDDIPVNEHVYWFSKCKYIINVSKKMGMTQPASSKSTSATVPKK